MYNKAILKMYSNKNLRGCQAYTHKRDLENCIRLNNQRLFLNWYSTDNGYDKHMF